MFRLDITLIREVMEVRCWGGGAILERAPSTQIADLEVVLERLKRMFRGALLDRLEHDEIDVAVVTGAELASRFKILVGHGKAVQLRKHVGKIVRALFRVVFVESVPGCGTVPRRRYGCPGSTRSAGLQPCWDRADPPGRCKARFRRTGSAGLDAGGPCWRNGGQHLRGGSKPERS